MAHLSMAIDEVRAQEAKELKQKGYEPILTKTRWLLLTRPEILTDKQETKLADILRYNLRSMMKFPSQGGAPTLLIVHLVLLGRIISG
jgi:hypothetical protein